MSALLPTSRPATLPHSDRLHDDAEQFPLAFGCMKCPYLLDCGGLRIAAGSMSCLDRCCGGLPQCDTVCPTKARQFVNRIREVDGFDLSQVPKAVNRPFAALPLVTPVLYGGGQRGRYEGLVVGLPMWRLIDRHQQAVRFETPEELAEKFGYRVGATVILTGVDEDGPLERFWALQRSGRGRVLQQLAALGIDAATTPNFSMFTDRPRHDDMHSGKRIGLAWKEMMDGGLATALHVNARTEHDWESWTDFIIAHPEVEAVSYEFKTPDRKQWHAERLIRLGINVGRPLRLVSRGGRRFMPGFAKVFAGVHALDTSSYVKTIKRQQASLDPAGVISWTTVSTARDELLTNLFQHNVTSVTEALTRIMKNGTWTPGSKVASNGRHEAHPRRLLYEPMTGQSWLPALDDQRMVTTDEA